MKKVLVAVGLIGLIAAACNSNSQPANTNNSGSSDQSQQSQQNTEMPSSTTTTPSKSSQGDNNSIDGVNTPEVIGINITSSGFSPANVTIHAGDYVQFTNKDSAPHWPASNPHPSHTDYPGFDALHGLAQNATYRFQFNKTGSWGYHDHLHPSSGGTITVLPR